MFVEVKMEGISIGGKERCVMWFGFNLLSMHNGWLMAKCDGNSNYLLLLCISRSFVCLFVIIYQGKNKSEKKSKTAKQTKKVKVETESRNIKDMFSRASRRGSWISLSKKQSCMTHSQGSGGFSMDILYAILCVDFKELFVNPQAPPTALSPYLWRVSSCEWVSSNWKRLR